MKTFNRIFVTPLASFYKVNLYHELAKQMSICVIFVGSASDERPEDFSKVLQGIPYYLLNEGPFQTRSKLRSCIKLFKLLKHLKARQWVVGGWDLVEYWLIAFLNKKIQNAVVVESTYLPCSRPKSWLKKKFIKRMSVAYHSGSAQLALLERLGFKGKTYPTGGVGLVDWQSFSLLRLKALNFIFIGRFVPEKNLTLLMAAFKQCSTARLMLVGEGPLEPVLKACAPSNVRFSPYCQHDCLPKLLSQYDVLILPSQQEAWGIVVEEAQLCGLPVIVSSAVGCAAERVTQTGAGMVFENGSLESLAQAIATIQNPAIYQQLLKKVQGIKFDSIRDKQLTCYID